MLLRASRCIGSTVILSVRSQSAAFSHGSTRDMETSSGGNLIVPTGFSARFRACEPGFPRSSPAAHGGRWASYAFVARLGRLPFCADAPSTRDILLTYAAKPHCSSPSEQNSWDSLSGCLARVYTLKKEGPMPSKRLGAQHIGARLGPARAASFGVRVWVAAIAIVAASISSAGAQDWPTRPIRLVVGAAAGGEPIFPRA